MSHVPVIDRGGRDLEKGAHYRVVYAHPLTGENETWHAKLYHYNHENGYMVFFSYKFGFQQTVPYVCYEERIVDIVRLED